ncbi:glycosyltransferase family 4 protein [Myxacorys almedinensis]|uniref:Glycosyltransferase n=1 Tax=Myxacorys almedinensis A TaxID=2690445 RepID=A0A8J7Z4H5_9CYAN|nr:glycosyltransferase family 1 protein [Myxacorys almedinensis]NDJ16288.1 glycosyltransferase [Myxacorys almedinensis A]
MLNITIDATPVLPKPSGIGFYVVNLIRALEELQLAQESPDFAIDLIYQISLKGWLKGNFSCPEPLQEFENLRLFPLPVKATNLFIKFPPLFLPYFEGSFGFSDIFHGTNYTVFPFRKSKRVLSIYDLTFVKYPQFTNSTVKAYAERVKQCLQWTDLVLTISHSSKQDIVELLGVPAEKVWVTPLASRYSVGECDRAPLSSVNYDFSKPYILFVSTIEPRKNIATLIEAFDHLKEKYHLEHQLVLIGQKGWLYESIFERIARSRYKTDIHHLSYLSDEHVALFYANADVFVYPSYYEGFGLPALEAMTLGAPVVTSNASSLPEVVGDAALLVDPNSVDDLTEAILQVVSSSLLRDKLIEKGKERAKLFSWNHTAKETLKAYKLLMS